MINQEGGRQVDKQLEYADKYSVAVLLRDSGENVPQSLENQKKLLRRGRVLEEKKEWAERRLKGGRKMFQVEFIACAGHRGQKGKEVGRKKGETEKAK